MSRGCVAAVGLHAGVRPLSFVVLRGRTDAALSTSSMASDVGAIFSIVTTHRMAVPTTRRLHGCRRSARRTSLVARHIGAVFARVPIDPCALSRRGHRGILAARTAVVTGYHAAILPFV